MPSASIGPIGVTLLAVLGLILAAGWAWRDAWPALGERPHSAVRIYAAWTAAAALWAAAHALLFGVGVPLIYRRRPLYLGIAAIFGLLALLAAITAGALYAAAANGR